MNAIYPNQNEINLTLLKEYHRQITEEANNHLQRGIISEFAMLQAWRNCK